MLNRFAPIEKYIQFFFFRCCCKQIKHVDKKSKQKNALKSKVNAKNA